MAEYFSHDYDAREDEKIQNLIYKLGMEGYGIYWSIIEMLYKNEGYMQTDYERIAFALHINNDIIKKVINDFRLFELNGNAFYSPSVLHRLKLRKGKIISAKKAAKVRWDKVKAEDANAMQTQCERNAKKKRKEKESKENKSKEIIYPTLDEFIKYFLENNYSKELALRAWNGYEAASWHDSSGKKIINWKQKAQHVWFREENKSKPIKKIYESSNFKKTITGDNSENIGEMPEYIKKLAAKKTFK